MDREKLLGKKTFTNFIAIRKHLPHAPICAINFTFCKKICLQNTFFLNQSLKVRRDTLDLLYWFYFSYNNYYLLRVLLIPHCGTNHTMLALITLRDTYHHFQYHSWSRVYNQCSACMRMLAIKTLTILVHYNYNSRIHLRSVWGIHNVVMYWHASLLVYNNNTVPNWFTRMAISTCIRLEFLSALTFLMPHRHKGFPKCKQLKY